MLFSKKSAYDWLIVGLGNPGLQYENTRHNVGFMAVDLFVQTQNGDFNKNKMKAVLGECTLKNNRILVVKPQTYMNNSGDAVSQIVRFYKIPLNRIIVVCDDINLDIGKIRIKRNGSDGGQKGMRDIIELLGNNEIMRIKIGVGSADAATTAMLYSGICTAMKPVFRFLDKHSNLHGMKTAEIDVYPDFLSDSVKADVKMSFSMSIGGLLGVVFKTAFKFLFGWIKITPKSTSNLPAQTPKQGDKPSDSTSNKPQKA
jgi:PTH1 family peptidyl-tRNA hydrolase